jgi:3-isopropylmalate/(R)-2-methylmalate dehydratase small subunit
MKQFKTLSSRMVPLPGNNMDTDQIIPARFLKATSREGFGENLFRDRRDTRDGSLVADFPLNNPLFSGSILLAGSNFGCGSSREHAAWAILGAGYQVVISSGFADIFRNNALNNALLPVELKEEWIEHLFNLCITNPEAEFVVDLRKQTLELTGVLCYPFHIPEFKRQALLKGEDDIDYLIGLRNKIESYETTSTYLSIVTTHSHA